MLTLFFSASFAQNYSVTGCVVDAVSNEKLPFVNIVKKGQTQGVISDMNGNFKIENNLDSLELTFSYVGYSSVSRKFKADTTFYIIKMHSQKIELAEVSIYPGENPAHRIINKVIENKNINNPEKRNAFSCNIYNKMYFTFAPSILPKDNEIEDTTLNLIKKFTEKQHLFLSESFTEKFFLYPDKNFDNVIASKVSGLNDPLFSMLMHQLQPFTFYKDVIAISDKKFINPISKGSTSKYFFLLEDTLYTETDTVFIISFKPSRNKKFDALKGVLYINTNTYAIQNVIAEPFEQNIGGIDIKIQQQYKYVNNQQWFPVELSAELLTPMPGFNKIKLLGIGKSYISEINLTPHISKSTFGAVVLDVNTDAMNKSDEFWKAHRYTDLDDKDIITYYLIDSIGKTVNLTNKITAIQSILNGDMPLGFINLNINKIIKYNLYEGLRTGLGLSTNNKISSFFSLGGYFAYGHRDDKFKYGGNLKFYLSRKKTLTLNLQYNNDIEESGNFTFFNIDNSFNYDFYRDFILTRFDKTENYKADLQFRSLKYAVFNISAETSQFEPLYDYRFGVENENITIFSKNYGIDAVSLAVRYAYGEKIIKNLNFNYSTFSKAPIIWFKYTKGLTGIMNGAFEFNKFLFRLDQSFYFKYIGKTSFRVDAGIVNGNVPASLLFYNKASFRNFNINVPYSFSTMRVNEFIADNFISIHFQHDFGKLIFGRGKFAPSPVVLTSFGIGNLNNKNNHYDINIKTMGKGYWESGFMINSLLVTGLYDLGVGAFYRYGAYKYSEFIDNLSIRLNVTFPFLN